MSIDAVKNIKYHLYYELLSWIKMLRSLNYVWNYFNKMIIEKYKEVLRINLSKKWLWRNQCHGLRYKFRKDGKAKLKVKKVCVEMLLSW